MSESLPPRRREPTNVHTKACRRSGDSLPTERGQPAAEGKSIENKKSAECCSTTQQLQFCWGTRTRTRKGRTRICSVTITPYPNRFFRVPSTPAQICGCKGTTFFVISKENRDFFIKKSKKKYDNMVLSRIKSIFAPQYIHCL